MHTPCGLQVREAEGESRRIEGYAILFGVHSAPLWADEESEAREMIEPGAVTKELLDGCDVKMTMFHDRQLILARSKEGKGTLSYEVDTRGVKFSFDAPQTVDGDKALELVKRGDLAGCSFMFTTRYWDKDFVVREVEYRDNKKYITYRVRRITGIYDFTLAADPAYPATSVEARELATVLQADQREQEEADARMHQQWREMRQAASRFYAGEKKDYLTH